MVSEKKKAAVLEFVNNGGSYRTAAEKFDVSVSSVTTWVRRSNINKRLDTATTDTAQLERVRTDRVNELNTLIATLKNQNNGLRNIIADYAIRAYRTENRV